MVRITNFPRAVAVGALAVLLPVSLLANLWFGASGVGEYKRSPDARFTAHAMNLSNGTFTGSRVWYIDVQVTEEASGREVWHVIHNHPPDADVPDYSIRGKTFIAWAADSSAVTVEVAGKRQLVLAVP